MQFLKDHLKDLKNHIERIFLSKIKNMHFDSADPNHGIKNTHVRSNFDLSFFLQFVYAKNIYNYQFQKHKVVKWVQKFIAF